MQSTRTPLEMVPKLTGGPHPTKSAARPPAVCAWQAAAAGGLSAQPCPMSPLQPPPELGSPKPVSPGTWTVPLRGERVFTDVFEARIETRPSWIRVGPKTHDMCPNKTEGRHSREAPRGRGINTGVV